MFSWLREKLQGVDIRSALILLFITVSTGHVGRLFADREAIKQRVLGYIFALALDVALALSLYEVGHAKERPHKLLALAGFVMACGLSGGFNVYYYRQFYPNDPLELSILLGLAAPVLAAFFGLLKGRGDVRRGEEKGQLELEKFRLELENQQQTALLLEKEKTKQGRELTKRLKLQGEAEVKSRQAEETHEQRLERERKSLANLGKSADILKTIREMPGITKGELGQRFEIGERTVNYHLAKLREVGAITRNEDGFQVLWAEEGEENANLHHRIR